jgi:hypothetical protein
MTSNYLLHIPSQKIINPSHLLAPENWKDLNPLILKNIRPESSHHHPVTRVFLFHDREGLCGKFSVQDRYVRCIRTGYQAKVSKDSCVEFFLKPAESPGYFNFEFNCGGNLLCYYIRNPKKKKGKRIDYEILTEEELAMVRREASLPSLITEEIWEPVHWELAFYIPYSLITRFTLLTERLFRMDWEGNFYKCADESSEPHWISWTPLPEKNFHLPEAFGTLRLM